MITVELRYYERTVKGVKEAEAKLELEEKDVGNMKIDQLKKFCYQELRVKVKVERKWRGDLIKFLEGKETLTTALHNRGPKPTVLFFIGQKETHKEKEVPFKDEQITWTIIDEDFFGLDGSLVFRTKKSQIKLPKITEKEHYDLKELDSLFFDRKGIEKVIGLNNLGPDVTPLVMTYQQFEHQSKDDPIYVLNDDVHKYRKPLETILEKILGGDPPATSGQHAQVVALHTCLREQGMERDFFAPRTNYKIQALRGFLSKRSEIFGDLDGSLPGKKLARKPSP